MRVTKASKSMMRDLADRAAWMAAQEARMTISRVCPPSTERAIKIESVVQACLTALASGDTVAIVDAAAVYSLSSRIGELMTVVQGLIDGSMDHEVARVMFERDW